MPRRRYEFCEGDKIKVLLWCARHCCLCGKFAGLGIEVAHLDPKLSEIENAIPLCFDCHAAIGHYNASHPRGKKYSVAELRARRNQVYEQHTSHLVSPVTYRLRQNGTRLPRVHFEIVNAGNIYPVKAKVEVHLTQGPHDYGYPETNGHYDGKYLWNLNPQQAVVGNFSAPKEVLTRRNHRLQARVDLGLIDIYEREHTLLPGGYIHTLEEGAEWYFEPTLEELVAK